MVIKYLASERCEEAQYRNMDLKGAFRRFWESNAGSDEEDESFGESKFVGNVSDNLKNGEFYLVIVVDEISETASRTIQFLNRKLDKLRLEIIEISKFSDDNRTIYVPNHVNKEIKTRTQPGKTTFVEMINGASERESEYIKELRTAWEDGGDFSIHMGTKGFSARYRDIPILYILPSHFRMAPRFKREYEQLFKDAMELLEKHFDKDLKGGVSYSSTRFSLEKIRAFVTALQDLMMKNVKNF